jgi:6-phosphogluconolactonase
MSDNIHLYQRTDMLYEQCAARILTLMRDTLSHQERFHIALAGGDTPRSLYRYLSHPPKAMAPDWQRVEFYFGDERHVGPEHPESNYRMAQEELFTPLNIRKEAIHRIHGEHSPHKVIEHYRQVLSTMPHTHGLPQFDLVLLGVGADGHVASLFPNSPLLEETAQTVTAGFIDKLDAWRFSLTLPVLNNARHIMLLISGSKKADIIRHVLHGAAKAMPLPVERLDRAKLEWFIDHDAGHFLKEKCEG